MNIRADLNGAAQACPVNLRSVALQKIFTRKKVDEVPEGSDEKIVRMLKAFDCLESSTKAVTDNFQSEDIKDRLKEFGGAYKIDHLLTLMQQQQEFVIVLGECLKEIRSHRLSTDEKYAETVGKCTLAYEQESKRAILGQVIMETYKKGYEALSSNVLIPFPAASICEPTVPALQDRLVAKMMSFFTACIIFPDMIESAMV